MEIRTATIFILNLYTADVWFILLYYSIKQVSH